MLARRQIVVDVRRQTPLGEQMLEVEPRAWHVTSDPRLRRGGSRRIVSLARRVPPCEAMAPAFDQLARDFSALTVV